jgi:hypothetical protein
VPVRGTVVVGAGQDRRGGRRQHRQHQDRKHSDSHVVLPWFGFPHRGHTPTRSDDPGLRHGSPNPGPGIGRWRERSPELRGESKLRFDGRQI